MRAVGGDVSIKKEKNAYRTNGLSCKRPNFNPNVFYYTQIIYIFGMFNYIFFGKQ